MIHEAITAKCQQVYQTIVATIERNEKLQPFSVDFSAILSRLVSKLEPLPAIGSTICICIWGKKPPFSIYFSFLIHISCLNILERELQVLINSNANITQERCPENGEPDLLNSKNSNETNDTPQTQDDIANPNDGEKEQEKRNKSLKEGHFLNDYDENLRVVVTNIFNDTIKSQANQFNLSYESDGTDFNGGENDDSDASGMNQTEASNGSNQFIDDKIVTQRTQHLMIEAVQQLSRKNSLNSQNADSSTGLEIQGRKLLFGIKIEEQTVVTKTRTESRCKSHDGNVAGTLKRKTRPRQEWCPRQEFKRRCSLDERQFQLGRFNYK